MTTPARRYREGRPLGARHRSRRLVKKLLQRAVPHQGVEMYVMWLPKGRGCITLQETVEHGLQRYWRDPS